MVRELVVLAVFKLFTLDDKALGSRPHSSSDDGRRMLRAELVAAIFDCTGVARDVFLLVECHVISVGEYFSEIDEAFASRTRQETPDSFKSSVHADADDEDDHFFLPESVLLALDWNVGVFFLVELLRALKYLGDVVDTNNWLPKGDDEDDDASTPGTDHVIGVTSSLAAGAAAADRTLRFSHWTPSEGEALLLELSVVTSRTEP